MIVDILTMCAAIFVCMIVALFAIIGVAELIIKWFEKDDRN